MKLSSIICFSLITLLLFSGCDPGDSDPPIPQNPTPQLTSISPTETVAHLPAFTLTVTGGGFISSSVIVCNGQDMQTQYISATELSCQVKPQDTTSAAMTPSPASAPQSIESFPVKVRNPAPGGGESPEISLAVSSNHSFNSPRLVTGSADAKKNPQILLSADQTLQLAWIQSSPTPAKTGLARSEDGGLTWTQPGTFSFPGFSLHKHAMSMDSSGNLNAGWGGTGAVYFRRSTDGGDTWSTPVQVCDTNTIKTGSSPNRVTTATDTSGHIYIAWSMNYTLTQDEIYFSASADNGATWSPAVNVSNNESLMGLSPFSSSDVYRSESPCLVAASNGNLYLAWHYVGYNYGNPDDWMTYFSRIYFMVSTDQGSTWSTPEHISGDSNSCFTPSLEEGANGQLSAGWHYQHGEDSFACFCGRDAGTWGDPVDIAPGLTQSYYIDHKVDAAGNINVVWSEMTGATVSSTEIYFSRSIDGGATWSDAINISSATGRSEWPVLEVDAAGYLYVAWEDNRTGTYRIYFTSSHP